MIKNIVCFPQTSEVDQQFIELERQQELIKQQRTAIVEREDKKLTPAQEAELKFLRGQVDMWQEKLHAKLPMPDASNNLWVAREELTRYVNELRTWGKDI